jgi:hypothetical protein
MIVAIHAYEDNYKGYYGMCYDRLNEVENKEEAYEIARTLAENVCFDFTDIYDIMREEANDAGFQEGTDEYDDYIYDAVQDTVRYEIYEVNSYNTIENMEIDYLCNSELFIKNHCIRQL